MLYRASTIALALAAVPSLTSAQELNGLPFDPFLIEDDPAPGASGFVVGSIDNPAVNGIGGWSVLYTSETGKITVDRIFGSSDGAPPAADLFVQGSFVMLDQGGFEFSTGLTDTGSVVYSASIPSLGPSIDSLWIDQNPLAIEGDPVPSLPGLVWRSTSRPSAIAQTSEPYFFGGLNDLGGASAGSGLFRGVGATPVLISGDQIATFPAPIQNGSSVDFDSRFSYGGSQLIAPVDLEGLGASEDIYMTLNSGPLTIGGLQVREDGPLPAALQVEPEERWDNFDFFAILDDGTYFFNGDTTASVDRDEFVIRDQEIILREGDSAGGGLVFSGSIESLTANRQGDLAFVWDVTDGTEEALAFNGRVLTKANDRTDLDGDGIEDATLVGFVGINSLAMTTNREVIFTADFLRDGKPTVVEAAGRLSVPDLLASDETLSLSAGGQVDFTLFTRPEVSADFYWLLGSLSGTAPGLPLGPGIVLPLNVDALFNLSLSSNTAPFGNNFGAPDTLGVGDSSFTLPAGTNPALAGLTANFAYVTIDVLSLSATSASNAVAVVLVP